MKPRHCAGGAPAGDHSSRRAHRIDRLPAGSYSGFLKGWRHTRRRILGSHYPQYRDLAIRECLDILLRPPPDR